MSRKSNGGPQVRAAGGVVWQMANRHVEVAVVHRPKYDDWSFPKGKLEPGETHAHGALREVAEETGLRCVLGHELHATSYIDAKGRSKTVRYWEMTVADGTFLPNEEVDEMRWLSLVRTAEILTHRRDMAVLGSFARLTGGQIPILR